MLVVLPLFHIYSLTVNMLFGLCLGAELVLHTRFDVDTVLHDLAAKRITFFAGVPTMYTAILNHPKAGETDLRALKFCGSGGAQDVMTVVAEILRQELDDVAIAPIRDPADRFQQLTGCPINEGWGMTETSPTGTFTPAHGMRKAGSCGMPLPRVELKFLSLSQPGADAPPGEPGELCIRGPNVMKGYWNHPEETKEAFFGRSPTRMPRASPSTATSAPATWRGWTAMASSASSIARRTCCCAAASTSTRG